MPFILTRLYQHNPSTGPSPPAHFRWESKINMATVDSMSLTSGDNRQCTGATFLARSSSRYNTASYNGKYGNPVTNLSQHLPLTTAVEYANDALHWETGSINVCLVTSHFRLIVVVGPQARKCIFRTSCGIVKNGNNERGDSTYVICLYHPCAEVQTYLGFLVFHWRGISWLQIRFCRVKFTYLWFVIFHWRGISWLQTY